VHHAVAIEPVAEGPAAQFAAARADAQKSAAHRRRDPPADITRRDARVALLFQIGEATAMVLNAVHAKGLPGGDG